MSQRRRRQGRSLQCINPRAAGIDVGSASHWVAIDPSLDPQPVRQFGAYTGDLQALANWLVDRGVLTVAMESTGVYWIPLFDVLAERGLDVWLVDARATKQVAGRKSDLSDCQWIQQLHAYGLLKRAFIPGEETAALRAYLRQRERWVTESARTVQHLQQALELMNVKLTEVVSDITGATGMAILDAILAGERDAEQLASHRDPHCRKSAEEIARALHGAWRDQHLFALQQAREHYAYLEGRIAACDERIEALLRRLQGETDDPPAMGKAKRDTSSHPFRFDAQSHCARMAGVDLTAIDGVNVNTVLTVLGEVGTDMTPWRSERAFGSWLGLAPRRRQSGRRLTNARPRLNSQRAANALRLAAQSVGHSKSALGAFYRRLRARLGAQRANVATAYKIAKLFYRMLKTKQPYRDIGQAVYDERFHARRLRSLKRLAQDLGFQLLPATPLPRGL